MAFSDGADRTHRGDAPGVALPVRGVASAVTSTRCGSVGEPRLHVLASTDRINPPDFRRTRCRSILTPLAGNHTGPFLAGAESAVCGGGQGRAPAAEPVAERP
jgi:hypothetical protein